MNAALVAAGTAATTSGIVNAVTKGELVVDEIFHVPQAQRYCAGDWQAWDAKITTPPGVYVLSAATSRIIAAAIRSDDIRALCTSDFLRITTNVPCAALAAFAIANAQSRTRDTSSSSPTSSSSTSTSKSSASASARAVVLSLFPPHVFLCGLYYTETPSTAFVLSAYAAARNGRTILSACALGAAVITRQTNAVWCLFIWALSVLDIIDPDGHVSNGNAGLLAAAIQLVHRAWLHRGRIVRQTGVQLLPVLALLSFIAANGGAVVLGDKSAHVATFHGMQLLYFLSFTLCAAAPVFLSPTRLARFVVQLRTLSIRVQCLAIVFVVLSSWILVDHGTVIHPYLLADNRHYAFYLWRRILRIRAARYMLGPIAAYVLWALHDAIEECHGRLWLLGFVACTAIATVPSPLFELRYFILPFLIVMLHVRLTKTDVVPLMACYIALNALTMNVFAMRPFTWPDGSTARFMW